MSEKNQHADIITLMKRQDKRLRNVERRTKYDDESDAPPLPPTVALNFSIREWKQNPEYRAVVTWGLVSPNTCQADVDKWIVQIRATDNNGNPVDRPGGSSAAHIRYEKKIDNKGDADPIHAIFPHLPRPKIWYWQARVAIKDKAHRIGPWSNWTTAQLPFTAARPKPPTPTGIALTFDTIEKTKWDRVRAIVTWNEISNWDIPGTSTVNVNSATAASNIGTFNLSADLNLMVGSTVEVKGVAPTAYNGEWKILTVNGPGTQVTANIGANPANSTSPGTMTDVNDKEDDVDRYMVQIRNTNAAGSVTNGVPRKRMVQARDLDADSTQAVAFEKHIRKTDYYQCRVRSIDRFNRKGDFSAWTPTTPAQSTDNTAPPVPTNVTVIGEHNHTTIEWDDPQDAADSDLTDVDVAFYQVQIATDKNFNTIVKFDRENKSNRKSRWSTKYKQKFWLRVRSVDASGNKSAWRPTTPTGVRPQKTAAARVVLATGGGTPVAADVEWINDQGLDLAGGGTNRAQLVSATADAFAWAEGGDRDGELVCTFTGSVTANRMKAGPLFRRVDNNNFLMFTIRDTASTPGWAFQKRDAGVYSTIASDTAFPTTNGQTYALRIVLSGNSVTCYIDGVSVLAHTLSGGNATKFGTGNTNQTGVGIYVDQAGTSDDGKSRFEDIEFTDSIGDTTVSDSFDRPPSASALGTADSGHAWTAAVGTWGIEEMDQSFTVFGNGVTLPVFAAEDTTTRTAVGFIDFTTGNYRLTGLGGVNLDPITMAFDRPTKLIMWAATTFSNETATEVNARFHIVVDEGGSITGGRMVSSVSAANDNANGRNRSLNTTRQYFVDASPDAPTEILIWWGYMCDGGANRPHTVRSQKMIVLWSYAPDIDITANPNTGETAATEKVPFWTKDANVRRYYQKLEV